MVNYTPDDPVYSASVPIVESDDAVNAENHNSSIEVLMDNIAWLKENAGIKGFIDIPTPSATSFTYDGSEKTVTFDNVDSEHVTIRGVQSATNAGTYTVIASLTNTTQYMWKDLTTVDKEITWTINKATGTVTLSASSVTIDDNSSSATVTVSNASGAVSVSSSDDTIAEASINNNVITISSPDEKKGAATITVSVAESSNYNATSRTIAVTANFIKVYGVTWDGTSTTALSRTDKASNFVNPVAAVNNGNGSSPFDNILPWSGMQKVEDNTAGTLVSIPKYWFKWTTSGNTLSLQISDGEKDGYHVSPAHADRGDGVGERDTVYVGRYHCANSTYKSTTGVQPQGSQTRSSFRSSIHNLGSDIWQYDYAMFWTIAMLYLVEYADWNSQKTIGYGCSDSSSMQNSGLTDAMVYHTGTNASSRTTYGHTQYRYIEDLWGNVYDWCDGIRFSGSSVYCIKNPANFSDSSGGTNVGTRATSSDFIKAWNVPSASGFEYALYPKAVGGSDSTYIPDYCNYSSSGVVLRVGGHYDQYTNRGLFCLDGNHSASYSDSYIGSRLQKLPSAA